jgi:hypothetical protein
MRPVPHSHRARIIDAVGMCCGQRLYRDVGIHLVGNEEAKSSRALGSQAWYCPGLGRGLMVLASFTTCIAAASQETPSCEKGGSYSVCSGRWG